MMIRTRGILIVIAVLAVIIAVVAAFMIMQRAPAKEGAVNGIIEQVASGNALRPVVSTSVEPLEIESEVAVVIDEDGNPLLTDEEFEQVLTELRAIEAMERANLPPPTFVAPEPSTPVASDRADADGDGLSDGEEAVQKTDPQNSDTDGDGLSDGEEVKTYRTNPRNVDTDGDGLSDGEEVKTYRTNPNLKDTDGDGFEDGTEVSEGYNPLGSGKL